MIVHEMTVWNRYLINGILKVLREFIDDTEYGVTYDRDLLYARLSDAFFSEVSTIIVAYDDHKVYGFAVIHAVADWHPEKFGYIEKMYLVKEARGKTAGRELTRVLTEWFDKRGCIYSFATSTARSGTTGHFTNLLSRYGFKDVGPTLFREQNNVKI